MSAQTINQCAGDEELRQRISATIAQQTWANPEFGGTGWGARVQQYGPGQLLNYFTWPIAIDNEASYAYAVETGNPHPGQDRGVISDENLSSGVQVHWPDDSTLPPAPAPIT